MPTRGKELRPIGANFLLAKKAGYSLTKKQKEQALLPDKHQYALRIYRIEETGDILVTYPWLAEGAYNKKITNRKYK